MPHAASTAPNAAGTRPPSSMAVPAMSNGTLPNLDPALPLVLQRPRRGSWSVTTKPQQIWPAVDGVHWRDGRHGRGQPECGANAVRLGVQHSPESGGDPEEERSGVRGDRTALYDHG